jgi:hypothetical protein
LCWFFIIFSSLVIFLICMILIRPPDLCLMPVGQWVNGCSSLDRSTGGKKLVTVFNDCLDRESRVPYRPADPYPCSGLLLLSRTTEIHCCITARKNLDIMDLSYDLPALRHQTWSTSFVLSQIRRIPLLVLSTGICQ